MHKFINASAGAGKTQRIVDICATAKAPKRRLVITLTESGQSELTSRLSRACTADQMPDVSGWYAFLINNYVRPYLPIIFPGIQPTGFIFKSEDHPTDLYRRSGETRYFSPDHCLYRESLSELAIKLAEKTHGATEKRLARIYDEIIIDEVQDIRRKSLDIIERLLKVRSPQLIMVGDVRQSVIASERTSQKNRSADGSKLLDWFRNQSNKGLLKIYQMPKTHRCNQKIADFADQIFPSDLGFASTESINVPSTNHDGVFLVHEKDIDDYLECFKPQALRMGKKHGNDLDQLDYMNIRKSKGMTFDRVIIFPTKPMLDLISKGKRLRLSSACDFYVAVTRARFSVAIIFSDTTLGRERRHNCKLPVEIWRDDHPTLF